MVVFDDAVERVLTVANVCVLFGAAAVVTFEAVGERRRRVEVAAARERVDSFERRTAQHIRALRQEVARLHRL